MAAMKKSPPRPAKQCSCGTSFTRKDLMHQPSVTPIGMLHVAGDHGSTLYCFTHNRWSCRTTFALPVETFRPEIREKIPEDILAGTEACEGHCSKIEDLEECHAECKLAPYRRFLLKRLIPRK